MIRELLEQYPKYHYFVASTLLALAMFGMGARLQFRDFVEIALKPKPFLAGVFFQLIGAPLLTLGLVQLIDVPPEIALGFFMLAALPTGALANVYTYLGRGNAALSVALTGVLTVLALLTAPLILRILSAETLSRDISMPTGLIVREISLLLLLPLGAGLVVARSTRHARRISKWAVRGSLVGLAVVVAGSLGSGRLQLGAYGWKLPILVIAYCALVQGLVFRLSLHVLRFSWRDSTALAIVSGKKNINLGLMIGAALFPLEGPSADLGGGILFVLLLFGGSSLFIGVSPAIQNYRHEKKRLLAEQSEE